MQRQCSVFPKRLAAEGHEEAWRVVLAALHREMGMLQDQRIARSRSIWAQDKRPFSDLHHLRIPGSARTKPLLLLHQPVKGEGRPRGDEVISGLNGIQPT